MAVINLAEPDDHLFGMLGEVPKFCFWCQKELAPMTILWSGYQGNVFLHVHCARDFALAVLYDSQRAAALITGQRFDAGMGSAVAAMATEAEPIEPPPPVPPRWLGRL